MPHYYEENDLERFNEIGKYRPDLYDNFMNYYQGVMSAGALSVPGKGPHRPGSGPRGPMPLLHRRLYPGVPGSRFQPGGDDRGHSRRLGHPGRGHPDPRHPGHNAAAKITL